MSGKMGRALDEGRNWWAETTDTVDSVADSIENAVAGARLVRDSGGDVPESVRVAAWNLDRALAEAWDKMVELRRACVRARRDELDSDVSP